MQFYTYDSTIIYTLVVLLFIYLFIHLVLLTPFVRF